MSDFDWIRPALGDIADVIDPHPSHRAPPEVEGGIPFVGIGDLTTSGEVIFSSARKVCPTVLVEHRARYLVAPGDIAYGRVATVGKVMRFGCVDEPFAISPTMALIKPNNVSASYLAHYLQSKEWDDASAKLLTGTTRSSLGIQLLRKIRITCPRRPEEQSVIGGVLDTLDTAIQETEAIIAKLKAVKQGLLHDLLTRGIDANGELRPPQSEAPGLYKMSALGWIPREWESHTLGTLADISGGVTLGRSIAGLGVVELPYLRVANVQDGYLDLTEIKKVRVLSSEVPRYKLEPGDVLMNEGGDFDKLGRGVIWSGELELCLHQNHVFRVRCDQVKLDSRYLAAYSASRFGKSYFVQASKQTTNLASINSTQLKAFPLMLPPPEEQHAIVEKLAGPDIRIESESLTRQKLLAQKSGLMDDLLTGRVRVTALLPDHAHAEESP